MLLDGYTPTTLAEKIDSVPSTIYDLLRCRYKQPSTTVFFNLIETFGCSADYLLGFVDFPPPEVVYHPPLRCYGARIRTLLAERKQTQALFIKNMGISSNLAHRWLSNQTLPTVEYLIKLANYFDISVDAFINRIK